MRITVKIFFVLLISSSFNTVFSQEYDFEIPDEEIKGIEFNGNLDTKWGLLNSRRSSPFYGIQFYNSPETSEYLSQYRLDFYLDGSYNYKQLGFFIKAFTQYAKEEPLSLSMYELYGSLNFSPRLSMSIGKRRFNWGKGYAFNPAGYVNAEKDPENPDLALAGRSSLYMNYNRSFNSAFLQNFSATAVILPPEAFINERFAPADNAGAALKLYFLVKNIDIDLMGLVKKYEPSRIGLDISANIRENLEIHAEYSYANDEISHITGNTIFTGNNKGSSSLLGLRYLNKSNTTLIFEYYHNNSGLSQEGFGRYLDYLKYRLETNNSELISQARQNMASYFRSKTLMRDYLYLKLSHPEPFDIVYSSVSVFTIYNLADNSFILSPQVSYKPFTNFEFILWPFFFLGKDNTEYGSKLLQNKVEIWLRFYF
jgi:hypothetical protein